MSALEKRQVAQWIISGSTGLSSEAMAMWLAFGVKEDCPSHPYDPDDFDRCLRLLEAVPSLRKKLIKLAKLSPVWARLVEGWNELEALHLEEVGLGWTKGRKAPKTYALMKEILAGPGHP